MCYSHYPQNMVDVFKVNDNLVNKLFLSKLEQNISGKNILEFVNKHEV